MLNLHTSLNQSVHYFGRADSDSLFYMVNLISMRSLRASLRKTIRWRNSGSIIVHVWNIVTYKCKYRAWPERIWSSLIGFSSIRLCTGLYGDYKSNHDGDNQWCFRFNDWCVYGSTTVMYILFVDLVRYIKVYFAIFPFWQNTPDFLLNKESKIMY